MGVTKMDSPFLPELKFKTSRSGGKGGQNVNKVSTKVELNFDVKGSAMLNDEQKAVIMEKLAHRINKEGVLQIIVQESRSQLANKELAVQRFDALIKACFVRKKKRVKTKPSKAMKAKRLEKKRKHSEKKKERRKVY